MYTSMRRAVVENVPTQRVWKLKVMASWTWKVLWRGVWESLAFWLVWGLSVDLLGRDGGLCNSFGLFGVDEWAEDFRGLIFGLGSVGERLVVAYEG